MSLNGASFKADERSLGPGQGPGPGTGVAELHGQGRKEEAMESQPGWSPFDEVFAELERLRFENTALWEGQLALLSLLEEHWERDRVRVENGVRARRMLRAVAA